MFLTTISIKKKNNYPIHKKIKRDSIRISEVNLYAPLKIS